MAAKLTRAKTTAGGPGVKQQFLASLVVLAFGATEALAAEPWEVAPGTRFEVRPGDLPAPYATPSVGNGSRLIERPAGVLPRVPEGFAVNIFAEGFAAPRWLAVAPGGEVFLTEPSEGRVSLLRDDDGDGVADFIAPFAEGFRRPHGLAVRPGALYVADLRAVWRLAYEPGDRTPRGAPEPITPPGALGRGGGHWTRNLAFAPDGGRFFVAIGSAGNIAEEAAPRATVRVFEADSSGGGSGGRSFATGLRNPVGIAFYPGSERLFVVVNERDGLGDELVPDYLTGVAEGDFLGWPYAYTGRNPQPGFAELRPDLVARSKAPDLLFRSHSAPLGLVFYDGASFPAAYRGDAFVALRGSWNAATPRGYMVVRVPFERGRPAGGYEAFMTGFWHGGATTAEVWGRPAGLAVAADGSLLVADDSGGVIWRVSYPR